MYKRQVYDKNNYVIAAVIVGEAKGTSANYAYILTAAKSEERLSDGTTIWEFEAVVDGKVVTLKTNSKFSSVISKMCIRDSLRLRLGLRLPGGGAVRLRLDCGGGRRGRAFLRRQGGSGQQGQGQRRRQQQGGYSLLHVGSSLYPSAAPP